MYNWKMPRKTLNQKTELSKETKPTRVYICNEEKMKINKTATKCFGDVGFLLCCQLILIDVFL